MKSIKGDHPLHVTLTREGGPSTILDLVTVRNLLAPDTDFISVGFRVRCGRPVDGTLADGTAAQLQLTEEKIRPELEPEWPVEAGRDEAADPRQLFNAHCTVLLDLTVGAQCLAIDQIHAEQIITEVFRGIKPAPKTFRVVFDRDETDDFLTRLKSVFETGNLAQVGVSNVLVTGFSEPLQHQLEYQP